MGCSFPVRLLSLTLAVGLAGSSYAQEEPVLPDRPFKPGEIPVPDLPPPADGGPLAYVHTTDDAIRLFQARVDRNPRDYVSYRILGEFHEKKAEETGDLASYERAELALRRCLEIAPNYDKARVTLAAVNRRNRRPVCSRGASLGSISHTQSLM